MDRESYAWAVLASPGYTVKEAGVAELAARTMSKIRGGPSFGQRLTSFRKAYGAERAATMSPLEAARIAERDAAKKVTEGGTSTAVGVADEVANAAKGTRFEGFAAKVPEFMRNNPVTTAAGLAALGGGAKMLHNAYKAYNSPMGRATRFAAKNPLVTGAGLLGAGMVAKGALSNN